MRTSAVFLTLAFMAVTACSTENSCGRTRAVTASGTSPRAQPADSLVRVRVSETDDSRLDFSYSDVSWDIPVSLQGDMISAIHLHNRNTGHDEGILYSFPAGDPPRFILSSNAIYDYPTPVRLLFDVMRAGHVYLDVHTATHPEGTARADLTSVGYEDWVSYACD